MLEDASSLRPDVEEERWVIASRHRRRTWEIVVEPDELEHVLVEGLMKGRYLEVTFRKGRPVAAYLYLPRRGAEHAARVSKASPGLLIDFNPAGEPIGIEITAPGRVSLTGLNRVLARLGQPRLQAEELAPLLAA